MTILSSKHVHKAELAHLKQLFLEGKLPHALLFSGPLGIGKLDVALELAQTILLHLERRTSPDLHRLRPESNNYSMDQIRDIQQITTCSPYEGSARVFIIEQADRLGLQPSNAFLKLLEEPPPNNYFILISAQSYKLLPTIASRVCRIAFKPPQKDQFDALLNEASLDLGVFTSLAEGSLGLAKLIAKYKTQLDGFFKVIPYGYRQEVSAYREVFETLEEETFIFHEFIPLFEALMLDYYRHTSGCGQVKLLWPPFSSKEEKPSLLKLSQAVGELNKAQAAHVKLANALERFFLKL